MKKIISILFLFLTTTLFAQSKLDSLVLVKVNEYRTSLGLNKVQFDTISFLAADNQASYLFKKGIHETTRKCFQKKCLYQGWF